MRRQKRLLGQASVEYMLALSVVAILAVMAAAQFNDRIRDGFEAFNDRLTGFYGDQGPIGG